MVSKNKHNILGISLENKKIKKNKKKFYWENYFPKSLNGVEFLINPRVFNFTSWVLLFLR